MKKEEIKEELVGIFGDVFSEGRYSEEEYISCVLESSRFRCYLENIVDKDTPSADTIYRHIKEYNISLLRGMYKEFIKERYGQEIRNEKYYVIVDETPWGYYGRNTLKTPWISGYKSKRGATGSFLFLSFMIVSIDKNHRFYFDLIPVPRVGYFKDKIIRDVLEEVIDWMMCKPEYVLLDRGFFSVNIVNTLEDLNLKYVIHARQTKRIKKKIKEKDNDFSFRYYLNNKILTTLHIHRCSNSKYVYTFVSNIEKMPREIREIYRKRWNIETGFRDAKMSLAKTRSTNIVIRYFLLLFSFVIYSLYNLVGKTVSLYTFLYRHLGGIRMRKYQIRHISKKNYRETNLFEKGVVTS